MIRGISQLVIDDKGRVKIPSRYRDIFLRAPEPVYRVVITVDRDGCLLLYPVSEWERVEKNIMELPNLNKQVRRIQRLLFGHACELELDGQGRVVIPPPLREFAGLEKQAVLCGQGNKFELWSEEVWLAQRAAWLKEEEGTNEINKILESIKL
ncbi:MAG: division/cell wall cluster transcriptional repressor MraZ [Pseudomonadota bacterium]